MILHKKTSFYGQKSCDFPGRPWSSKAVPLPPRLRSAALAAAVVPVASLTLRQSRALPRSPHNEAAARLLTGVRHFSFSRRQQQSTATQLHRDYFSLFSGRRANYLCFLTQIYVFFERSSSSSKFLSHLLSLFLLFKQSIQPKKPTGGWTTKGKKWKTQLHRLKNEMGGLSQLFLDLDRPCWRLLSFFAEYQVERPRWIPITYPSVRRISPPMEDETKSEARLVSKKILLISAMKITQPFWKCGLPREVLVTVPTLLPRRKNKEWNGMI